MLEFAIKNNLVNFIVHIFFFLLFYFSQIIINMCILHGSIRWKRYIYFTDKKQNSISDGEWGPGTHHFADIFFNIYTDDGLISPEDLVSLRFEFKDNNGNWPVITSDFSRKGDDYFTLSQINYSVFSSGAQLKYIMCDNS